MRWCLFTRFSGARENNKLNSSLHICLHTHTVLFARSTNWVFLLIRSKEVEAKSFLDGKYLLCWWFSVKLNNYGSCMVYGWWCRIGSTIGASPQPPAICGFDEFVQAHRSRIFQGKQEVKHQQQRNFECAVSLESFPNDVLIRDEISFKCTVQALSTFLTRYSLKFHLNRLVSASTQSIYKEHHLCDWILLIHSFTIIIYALPTKALISVFFFFFTLARDN